MLERAKITAGELVVVLSHFDIGVIESVERFRGGSRQTPKVLVSTPGGEYLLKRRSVESPGGAGASAANSPLARVRRAHMTHHHLRDRHLPVPELLPTRSGESFLYLSGDGSPARGAYELFRFLRGAGYARTREHADGAGQLLAQFHSATDDLIFEAGARLGGYHARDEMDATLEAIGERLDEPRARVMLRSLGATYRVASERAEGLGVSVLSAGVVHSDWHPGNLVFRGPESATSDVVMGIVDLDSVKLGPRVMDVANGALQFGVSRSVKGEDAAAWRISISPETLGAFCAGYRRGASETMRAQVPWAALPWLMAEALIVEAAAPIAATGRFGRLDPLPILAMVDQTAASIVREHARLVSLGSGT